MPPKILLIIFIALITSGANNNKSTILSMWTQVIPDNKISLRAIVRGRSCPTAIVDNKKIQLHVRQRMQDQDHPHLMCELTLAANTKSIHINNQSLPTLAPKIKKIAIIGDTGCRIANSVQQDCLNPTSWPLKKIFQQVLIHKPDLIIHLGDYHYREAACKDIKKCGSIYGYNWTSWQSEWFKPAQEALLNIPFLYVRGNHEDCNRAYKGWFKYLAVEKPQSISIKSCNNFSLPWAMKISDMTFLNHDSSYGLDNKIDREQIKWLKKHLLPAINKQNTPVWLLTHRSVWSYLIAQVDNVIYGNKTLQTLLHDIKPKNLVGVISGHIHFSQLLQLNNQMTQIIIGNSGTKLEKSINSAINTKIKINNLIANLIKTSTKFGFGIINMKTMNIATYDEKNIMQYQAKFK